MSVEWSDDLNTRIKWIDEQHQEMFIKAHLLTKAFNEGKGKEELINTLRFLGDYIISHFEEEENLQLKYDYPYYLAHKAFHQEFIKDYKKYKEQLADYGASTYLVYEVKEKLMAWIKNHIYQVDKAMADYLINYIKT